MHKYSDMHTQFLAQLCTLMDTVTHTEVCRITST